MLDGFAAAAYFPDDEPASAAAEAGASASLCEFDPLMMNDSAGDAAMPRDAGIIHANEVLCVAAYMVCAMTSCLL